MSMAPLGGILGSAAGVPHSQTAGETERAQKDSLAQQRTVDADQRAELAAGIGQTEQDQESSERDADGRRPWEAPAQAAKDGKNEESADTPIRQSKDATGQSGTQLDLTG
ncbi:MAG: hypothetical protein WD738_20190 [Pirellulales bacterium]